MPDELTIDKCVLVHCDSRAADADTYRDASIAFLAHWDSHATLTACVNAGIQTEYTRLPEIGKRWWTAVVQQSRYRTKLRVITRPKRTEFCKKKNVPLHGEDFDYVDAASQSDSLLWLSNEGTWQNKTYRQRIHRGFSVAIKNVNEFMASLAAQDSTDAS